MNVLLLQHGYQHSLSCIYLCFLFFFLLLLLPLGVVGGEGEAVLVGVRDEGAVVRAG